MRPTRSFPVRIEPLEARIALATFTVTTTADSGAGSFRQAILNANANPGADEIVFDFPAFSHMIELASALPTISGPTAIVGDETMAHSATPRFLLSGLQAGSASGLRFGTGSSGSSVSGLAISGFARDGIEVTTASDIVITGCLIGALAGPGNGSAGIRLVNATNVTIGGHAFAENLTEPNSTEWGESNIIAGNRDAGIVITRGAGHAIYGNLIGITPQNVANPNAVGIHVQGASLRIGGPELGAGNIISGNASDGIRVDDAGGLVIGGKLSGIVHILGNFIGTDAAGIKPIPNGGNGILGERWSVIRIGGVEPGAMNLISGNLKSGIQLVHTAGLVQGNFIGTDVSGTIPIGNGYDGINLLNAHRVTLGGTATGAGNLISGNGLFGIAFDEPRDDLGASYNTSTGRVEGNTIGSDRTGSVAMGNRSGGIFLAGVLGTVSGNLVSGNLGHGITVKGSDHTIAANFIGVTGDGASALGNGQAGISFQPSVTSKVTVRGNVISGNGASLQSPGIHISTKEGGHVISDNLIGLDATGSIAIPNSGAGISGKASVAISNNTISGNLGHGVDVTSSSWNLTVVSNRIGTDRAGAIAVPNQLGGVQSTGPSDFRYNLISGNDGIGLEILGAARVWGNYIGTDATGTTALGNTGAGIRIAGIGHLVTVGWKGIGLGNIIASNGGNGIEIIGSTVAVSHNRIGIGIGGEALGNAGDGLRGRAGVTAADNIIGSNGGHGIMLESSTGGAASITDNFIGVASNGTSSISRGNGGDGIHVAGTAAGQDALLSGTALSIENNVIAGNGRAGIYLKNASNSTVERNVISEFSGAGIRYEGEFGAGAARENNISGGNGPGIEVAGGMIELARNVIYGNTGIPIDLGADGATRNDAGDADAGPNELQNSIAFRSAVERGGQLIVRGSFDGAPSRSLRIEFFSVFLGPDGEEWASHFFGETLLETDAAGHAALAASFPLPGPGQRIFATVTDLGNRVTSEASLANILAGHETIAIGTGAGARGVAELVRAQMPNETLLSVVPYGTKYRGGVHVAHADLDGDGLDDLITAPARGGKMIRAFSGLDGSVLAEWAAAPGNYRGGISIAAGDLDGDGAIELAVARRGISKPVVSIHDALTGGLESQFTAFAGARRSGLNLSTGDLDGDGDADLVVSWATGSAVARAFTVAGEPLSPAIRPFEKQVSIGAFTAVIPATSASPGQIAIGSGYGSRAAVEVFDTSGALLESVPVFKHRFAAGIRLAAADVDGDGIANIIAARGAGVSTLEALAGDGRWLGSVFSPAVRSGIFIA